MAKAKGDRHTADLFAAEKLFPVHAPVELGSALDFNTQVSAAMKAALEEARDHGIDRYQVAARMSAILGVDVTKGMLDAYTSQARESHTISLVRFKALARATGCLWLWEVAVEGDGLTLLQGEEAVLAQAAWAEKQARHYAREAKRLKQAAPLEVKRLRRT